MTSKFKIKSILLTVLSLAALAGAAEQQEIRRFLISAGANNGGRDKVILRYAVSDANAFANVLIDMGGVERNNALILADPSRRELLGGMENLGRLVAANEDANVRTEIFVYYSGHADEEGLKLAGETLSWTEFRNAVHDLDADVKVAVIDACGSGAITRTKGGVTRPAFLSDASMDMRGYAFLTSSNENEASQESDRIRGSYFTHALLSGMRGAADMTGNGMVTINEAYQYAFNETIERTQNTRAGTQHPSRDMNLAGTGDIVMTDLRQTSAMLSLDAQIEGRFFIRDEAGNLFAEVRKLRGRPLELGIPPGRYTVQMEAPSRRWSAGEVVISYGATTTVSMNDMRPIVRRSTVARGLIESEDGAGDDENIDVENLFDDDDYTDYIYEDDEETIEELRAMMAELRTRLADSASADSASGLSDSARIAREKIALLDSACATPDRLNTNLVVVSNEPASGTQLSFANLANAEFCGTQIGFFNARTRESRGLQAGYINMSTGNFHGIQFGAINASQNINTQFGSLNIARDVGELQIGAMNVAVDVRRSQVAMMNIGRDVGGAQVGMMNIGRNIDGAQVGMMNVAVDINKSQVGMMNIARDVNGSQVGMMNIARDVNGAQVGMMNIARETSSRQVGLMNIVRYAEKSPIGFLNIVGNGIHNVNLYAGTGGEATLSFRFGMPGFYSIFEYSLLEGLSEETYWPMSRGHGFGTHFGMNGKFALNLDIVWSQAYNDRDDWRYWNDWNYENKNRRHENEDGRWNDDYDDRFESEEYWATLLFTTRFGASYRFTPYLAITGGVSLNMNIESREFSDTWNKPKQPLSWYSSRNEDMWLHAWPGIYVGITFGKLQATFRDRE